MDRGLSEHSQDELGLFVDVERAWNDDVLARLQLTVLRHLTEVGEQVWRLFQPQFTAVIVLTVQ